MSRELDEACVLAMGWVKRHSPNPTIYAWERPDGSRAASESLPYYSTDHAAARLLEDEIERRGLQDPYIVALGNVLWDGWGVNQPLGADWMWDFLRVTPEQKARAFLEAVRAK